MSLDQFRSEDRKAMDGWALWCLFLCVLLAGVAVLLVLAYRENLELQLLVTQRASTIRQLTADLERRDEEINRVTKQAYEYNEALGQCQSSDVMREAGLRRIVRTEVQGVWDRNNPFTHDTPIFRMPEVKR